MTAVMSVIDFPSSSAMQSDTIQSERRNRRAWLAALPWAGVLIVAVAGLLLPVGMRIQALTLSLSACAGVSLLLSRLAVRETCASFETELAELRRLPEDLLERMIAYGEASVGITHDDICVIRDTASKIALKLGIDEKEAEAIGRAAVFHDVGKVAVPAPVLRKPSRLTTDEFELVKTHTVIGGLIIGASPHLQRECDAAKHHHEWWDGSGYPDGLRGDEIPLVARITAVADVFQALMARRPYKEPWPAEQALQYVRERSGSQFDAEVVEAFLELHAEGLVQYPLTARVQSIVAV